MEELPNDIESVRPRHCCKAYRHFLATVGMRNEVLEGLDHIFRTVWTVLGGNG